MVAIVAAGAGLGFNAPTYAQLVTGGVTYQAVDSTGARMTFDPGRPPGEYSRILYQSWGGAVTATTEAYGCDAGNAITDSAAEYWQPTSRGAQWQIQYPYRRRVTAIGIGAHNLGSVGARVTVETFIASAYTVQAEFTPADDSAILIVLPTVNARGVRISISEIGRIGYVAAGPAVEMPVPAYSAQTPIGWSDQVTTEHVTSAGGYYLGSTVKRTALGGAYEWAHLREQWWRDAGRPMQRALNRGPFFIAGRPSAAPEDCAFAWTSGGQGMQAQRMGIADFVQVSLQVIGQGAVT